MAENETCILIGTGKEWIGLTNRVENALKFDTQEDAYRFISIVMEGLISSMDSGLIHKLATECLDGVKSKLAPLN